MFDSIEEAIKDLKLGKPIIVVDDENRENEGDFICLAEHATPEMINFMATKDAVLSAHQLRSLKQHNSDCP